MQADRSAAHTEFAWLIEAGPDSLGRPFWWADGWTWDALRAFRYPTKEDAKAAIKASNLSARAVEHGFMGSETT